jgi:hypothetical protein
MYSSILIFARWFLAGVLKISGDVVNISTIGRRRDKSETVENPSFYVIEVENSSHFRDEI